MGRHPASISWFNSLGVGTWIDLIISSGAGAGNYLRGIDDTSRPSVKIFLYPLLPLRREI